MGQPKKRDAAEQQILPLARVLQSLREEDHVDVLIETTISYLKEHFNYSLIWIALYDRLNHILIGKGGITPSKDTAVLQQRLVLSPGDLLEQVVISQNPLGLADLRTEKRAQEWLDLAHKFNIQGTIILPIRYKDRCLGLVLLGSRRWGYLLAGEAKARLMMVLGELGAALYRIEIELHHQQTRRADEPLLELLENLRTLPNLTQKLEAVVQATHKFVLPTRTNIYWFEPQKRYFWLRVSNQLPNLVLGSNNQQAVPGMTVQELSDFYYALSVNQIVSIGEGRSSLKSYFTGKLLERLRVRSILVAPIIWQKDLLGFLAMESKEPRIWTEADKNFVKGAAGLVSLAIPGEGMETTIKKIKQDAQLTSQIAQAIYNEHDLEEVLRNCAAKVLERFSATRFLLLQYNHQQNKYDIFYQTQPYNKKPLTFAFDEIKQVDCELLQQTKEAVSIENLEEDLQFFNWRSPLLEKGVRSLLISNCGQTYIPVPEALLLIGNDVNRCWTTLEKQLLQVISRQIGVTIRQWQLHQHNQQQQKILLSFHKNLSSLKHAQSANTKPIRHLECTTMEQIASVLNCPLVVLLSWMPGDDVAEIIPGVISNNQFTIVSDTPIPLKSEVLIQRTLSTDGLLPLTINDLPPNTKKWLSGQSIGQILVMVLRTAANYEPTGLILIADHLERQWPQQSFTAIETLVTQLAWFRRNLQITQILQSKTEELQQLNWYKHRRLENLETKVTLLVEQIHNLGIRDKELTYVHYQQLRRQLDNTTAAMSTLMKLEQWQFRINQEIMPIRSLIKRVLERVENLLQQKKLWVGVHGLGQQSLDQVSEKTYIQKPSSPENSRYQALAISGDVIKIELILYELLETACERSTVGGRIDIWCRRADERSLEMSITDNGVIEPQLLSQLQQQTFQDMLTPSVFEQSLGLHLLICQRLMQQIGGSLHFYQLPDGRVVSLLLLPLAVQV
ncbi:GAF domain-containing protein [Aetokthonos hydrillicola Thurmond2011]|jgi:GAF domain-containing protein/signal transduction histidine kinase|uniref:GAF domain-containing protein n=1 Tax=Aetokthonos hydrillicola Thurmond2011 TaxID=2712845 RepID=A0AAP5IB45_9CYAN|nr:GAF domain-containing protein [Aetokthonos hydrillicola]MBO3461377.1 GAF domain-containing protein [Aetokthonos hydrillicola CCALA 1050]MBW4586813.1 GAF domain-containing protein [Aetokthonos hydrillicola CCALA 1050]MDR9895830.1 GAF domain-containing protein [Aetokthonos hydrillicola Thurmond2011]